MKSSFLFLSFFAFHFLLSQEVSPPSAVVVDSVVEGNMSKNNNLIPADSVLKANPITSNTVYPKTFSPDYKSKYKGEAFDYTTIQPKESLLDRMIRRVKKILTSIFGELDPIKANDIAQNIFRLIAVVIIAFILYFLVKYLVGKEGNLFFSKKNKKLGIESGDLHENIHEINFPHAISVFETSKDFRSAIRYQFLYLLKKLSDKKLIEWDPKKTNKDYLCELKIESLRKEYKRLSYIFENVWYGEFEIDENAYQNFKNKFNSVKV